MAGDVDNGEQARGEETLSGAGARGQGLWMIRALSTLAVVSVVVVPVLAAFGLKYYQDGQLLKRHVSIKNEKALICLK